MPFGSLEFFDIKPNELELRILPGKKPALGRTVCIVKNWVDSQGKIHPEASVPLFQYLEKKISKKIENINFIELAKIHSAIIFDVMEALHYSQTENKPERKAAVEQLQAQLKEKNLDGTVKKVREKLLTLTIENKKQECLIKIIMSTDRKIIFEQVSTLKNYDLSLMELKNILDLVKQKTNSIGAEGVALISKQLTNFSGKVTTAILNEDPIKLQILKDDFTKAFNINENQKNSNMLTFGEHGLKRHLKKGWSKFEKICRKIFRILKGTNEQYQKIKSERKTGLKAFDALASLVNTDLTKLTVTSESTRSKEKIGVKTGQEVQAIKSKLVRGLEDATVDLIQEIHRSKLDIIAPKTPAAATPETPVAATPEQFQTASAPVTLKGHVAKLVSQFEQLEQFEKQPESSPSKKSILLNYPKKENVKKLIKSFEPTPPQDKPPHRPPHRP